MKPNTPIVAGILTIMLAATHARNGHAQDLRAGIEDLAKQIAGSVPQGQTRTLAVADFSGLDGTTSDLGRYVASRLTTRLALPKNVRVIERQRLGQVLHELKLSMSDLVDPAKTQRLGQMLGVQLLVVGSISDLGSKVDIDARVIDINTAQVLFGSTATISKDSTVQNLMSKTSHGSAKLSETNKDRNARGRSNESSASRVFADSRYRVTLLSFQKSGNKATALLQYENLMDERVRFRLSYRECYLNDDLGNRWSYKEDTAELNRAKDLPPGGQMRTRVTYTTKAGRGGSRFALYGDTVMNPTFPHHLTDISNF